jgi:hypothetical protein
MREAPELKRQKSKKSEILSFNPKHEAQDGHGAKG